MPVSYSVLRTGSIGVALIWCCCSCETLQQSSKYQFTDGYYRVHEGKRKVKVYVQTGTDTIKEYNPDLLKRPVIDTNKIVSFVYPDKKPDQFRNESFSKGTLDFDVLTVLFKYRPPAKGFPPQFNATFNGAVFLGYRTDIYTLRYGATPLHAYKRQINHFGYSAGIFSGFGTARIDEYVTQNALQIQYDGLVNLSGVALIIAVNKLTAGVTAGIDHLLDRNRKLWVNNGQPWIGLSLGLNLN